MCQFNYCPFSKYNRLWAKITLLVGAIIQISLLEMQMLYKNTILLWIVFQQALKSNTHHIIKLTKVIAPLYLVSRLKLLLAQG